MSPSNGEFVQQAHLLIFLRYQDRIFLTITQYGQDVSLQFVTKEGL